MSDHTDPTASETYEGEAFEDGGEPDEYTTGSIEAPEADTAEQLADLREREERRPTRFDTTEADPADAADQRRVVELDEDEYRA
jgi:hypothetical protein